MIHLTGPYLLAAALVGLGAFGITVRRNAVLLLVGVELVLSGGLVLLVATQAAGGDRWAAGSVLPPSLPGSSSMYLRPSAERGRTRR